MQEIKTLKYSSYVRGKKPAKDYKIINVSSLLINKSKSSERFAGVTVMLSDLMPMSLLSNFFGTYLEKDRRRPVFLLYNYLMKYVLALLLLVPQLTLACGMSFGEKLLNMQSVTEIEIALFFIALGYNLVFILVFGAIIIGIIKLLPQYRHVPLKTVFLKFRKKLLIVLTIVSVLLTWVLTNILTSTTCLLPSDVDYRYVPVNKSPDGFVGQESVAE